MTESPMPKSRGSGIRSFRNTLARRAAATGTPAEIRAALAAEVKTSARFCSPKYRTTPVRPKSRKAGSRASRTRKPRR